MTTTLKSRRLPGRPLIQTAYSQDMALLNTPAKRRGVYALVVGALLLPFVLSDHLLLTCALGMVAAIGAIGLNLVTGYAGQISLGHAFFIGLGAYTAAVLGGDPSGPVLGYGLPFLVWFPAAGIVAAVAGLIVGPLAVRLRGLYLAVVTLGLVFVGEHIFREARSITGGPGVGRHAPDLQVFGIDFGTGGTLFGFVVSREQRQFVLALLILIVFAIIGRNIARSKIGRAFSAVRDRDVAAAVIGVGLTRHKLLAFAMSSFFAGITGALFYSIVGFIDPSAFSLQMSIQYLAMVLIGGVATISGAIVGALFITFLARISGWIAGLIPGISTDVGGGGLLSVFELEAILYGLLIVGFLIFEPRGLVGIWVRIRNYWKGWPFSY